jgi:hypothetical protein
LLLNTIHHPPPPPCFFVLTAPQSFCLYSHLRILITDTKTSKLGLGRGPQKNQHRQQKAHKKERKNAKKTKIQQNPLFADLYVSISLSLKVVSTDRSRGEKTFKKAARREVERKWRT